MYAAARVSGVWFLEVLHSACSLFPAFLAAVDQLCWPSFWAAWGWVCQDIWKDQGFGWHSLCTEKEAGPTATTYGEADPASWSSSAWWKQGNFWQACKWVLPFLGVWEAALLWRPAGVCHGTGSKARWLRVPGVLGGEDKDFSDSREEDQTHTHCNPSFVPWATTMGPNVDTAERREGAAYFWWQSRSCAPFDFDHAGSRRWLVEDAPDGVGCCRLVEGLAPRGGTRGPSQGRDPLVQSKPPLHVLQVQHVRAFEENFGIPQWGHQRILHAGLQQRQRCRSFERSVSHAGRHQGGQVSSGRDPLRSVCGHGSHGADWWHWWWVIVQHGHWQRGRCRLRGRRRGLQKRCGRMEARTWMVQSMSGTSCPAAYTSLQTKPGQSLNADEGCPWAMKLWRQSRRFSRPPATCVSRRRNARPIWEKECNAPCRSVEMHQLGWVHIQHRHMHAKRWCTDRHSVFMFCMALSWIQKKPFVFEQWRVRQQFQCESKFCTQLERMTGNSHAECQGDCALHVIYMSNFSAL